MTTRAFEDRIETALERMEPVKQVGMRAAQAVHAAVMRDERTRRVADALHGTWLGHPLHPVLTDVTIGAWALAGAFDAIGELADSDSARRTGDTLTGIGSAAALPTALTGMTDYSTIPKPSATAGALHGALNAINLGLYLLSLRERRRGNRPRALLLSGLALGLTGVSAWLGGHLVYKSKVGVDHSDTFSGPQDWTPVLAADALGEREPKRVELNGQGVLLFREGSDIYALGAACAHAGAPLDQGTFDDASVQCPWHDSVFDLRDGHILHGPATQPQPVFDARIQDSQVELRLRED